MSGLGSVAFVLLLLQPARVERVAFGSDNEQGKPQEIWDAILEAAPDVFIFAGDNVFVDSRDPDAFAREYRKLGAKPGFQTIRERAELLAIWDDHDMGENDAGRDFPAKEASKRAFLEFFAVAQDSPRRARAGLYDAVTYGAPGERLQVVLLDTRYFRDPLRLKEPELPHGLDIYAPHDDPTTTLLGQEQWRWLEATLAEPADVRLIVSSIQVIPEDHRYESWSNFPHERRRLLELAASSDARAVVFLTGDRNLAEISRYGAAETRLYELTSSPMTQLFPPTGGGWSEEPNRHRVSDGNYRERNFGLVTIDWARGEVALDIRDVADETVFRETVTMR